MPYDKGDFTQQGINGDVSALVRLNEKRVMKVVLSSDDESDNCDVSGAVYDMLNGTSYSLGGSEPSGTITITENGTGLDVARYALADVNVPSAASLIQTLELGTLETTSTSATDTGKSFSVANAKDYDLFILVTKVSELPTDGHVGTISEVFIHNTTDITDPGTAATVNNKYNAVTSGTKVVSRMTTSPYGVFIDAPTFSDDTLILPVKMAYSGTNTKTINGTYTGYLYALRLRDYFDIQEV